jgi:hypothetical protein
MNIDITPIDFLSDAQKKQISKAVFGKFMDVISKIEVSATNISVDVSKEIGESINAIFEDGQVYDHLDTKKIGKALSEKMLEALAMGNIKAS